MFQIILTSISFVDVIAAVVVIAAVLVSLGVVLTGVLYVLSFIRGVMPVISRKPPKGYQYQFIDKEGRGHYGSWTRKDDYFHDRRNRR